MVKKVDRSNPFRFIIKVLDLRNDEMVYKAKNLNYKQAQCVLKDLKLKFK